MFQYAAGRALALRRGSELQLDVGWLHPHRRATRFRYELGSFPVDAELISAYRHRRREQLRERLGLAPPARRYTAFPFDPKVLELPGRVRLIGYWQSEKYFQDYEARDPRRVLSHRSARRPQRGDRCGDRLFDSRLRLGSARRLRD